MANTIGTCLWNYTNKFHQRPSAIHRMIRIEWHSYSVSAPIYLLINRVGKGFLGIAPSGENKLKKSYVHFLRYTGCSVKIG